MGTYGTAADGGALDVDGLASLLPGLDLFVHSLLFGDNYFQRVGHPLEFLLVCIVEFIHALGVTMNAARGDARGDRKMKEEKRVVDSESRHLSYLYSSTPSSLSHHCGE